MIQEINKYFNNIVKKYKEFGKEIEKNKDRN
jgi:hypothetical protein